MATGRRLLTDLSCVTCAVCMDIFENPCVISCGHRFCFHCLDQFLGHLSPQCPMCRQCFDMRSRTSDDRMDHFLRTEMTECLGCKMTILLCQCRVHSVDCARLKALEKKTIDQQKILSPVVPGTNRHTFQCPYCKIPHLDQKGLVKHCNEKHAHCRQPVVCPICASMPWGDPNFVSANFIQHLNGRHQFEYDTFVDYQQDDDAMLQAAMMASLNDAN